ncbi:MAG: alpha/beta fold hydrolase [Stellaceae bacterium]
MGQRFLSLSDAVDCFEVEASDGARLPVYDAGGADDAPALLAGHANGLAAGSYGPWLRDLARHFHVFAFDARGHGGSSWPDGPLERVFAIDRIADDLAALVAALRARLGGAPLHYAGHSLAAAAAVRLAVRGIELPFERITLFEPPIFPPKDAPNYAEAIEQQERLIRGAARRQTRWDNPEALRAHLGTRGVFRTFMPEMLRAHCQATLRTDPAGGCVLCCPPAVESTIFAVHRDADTWQHLPRIRQRFHLVSGDASAPDRDWVSGAMSGIAAKIPGADRVELPGAGHMMIFQQPDVCRELLLRAV